MFVSHNTYTLKINFRKYSIIIYIYTVSSIDGTEKQSILSICDNNVDLCKHNTVSFPLQLSLSGPGKIQLLAGCILDMDVHLFLAMSDRKSHLIKYGLIHWKKKTILNIFSITVSIDFVFSVLTKTEVYSLNFMHNFVYINAVAIC